MNSGGLFVIGLAVFAVVAALAIIAAPFFLVREARSRVWLAAHVAIPVVVAAAVVLTRILSTGDVDAIRGMAVFMGFVFMAYGVVWLSIQLLVVVILGVNRIASRNPKVETRVPAVALFVSLALGILVALTGLLTLSWGVDDSEYLRERDGVTFAQSLPREPPVGTVRHSGWGGDAVEGS